MMSDASNTSELIVAKLRKVAKQAEWYQALDTKLLTAAADALEAATSERDAALAAVERVRDLANSLRGRYADNSDAAYFTKQFLAALDGAPEPEAVEWEERLAACDKHGTHCWSCTRHTERRRPAGEWHRLPVEGESK